MTSVAARPGDEAASRRSGARKLLPRHWFLWSLGVVASVGIAIGVYAWTQYRTLTSAKYNVISYNVPAAPHLIAGTGETIYRIDPTQSEVRYAVDEKLFGHDAHTAEGTTNGIAGDIALNDARPSASRVGQISVNVEQLHSDNNLRDAKMRESYLESHQYPLAQLTVSSIRGLPDNLATGKSYHFTMQSQLVVKNTPAGVHWDVDGTIDEGQADRHGNRAREDVDVGDRPDQHRGPREHLRRRHAHDEAHRARPVEVQDPDRDRRAGVGAAREREGRAVVPESRDAAAAVELRVVPQPRRGRCAALDARDRSRRRQCLRRHRHRRRGEVHAAVARVAARRAARPLARARPGPDRRDREVVARRWAARRAGRHEDHADGRARSGRRRGTTSS